MKEYLKLLQNIIDNGITKEDRTGVGCRSLFGTQMRFNMSEGTLPLVTTRKIFTRGMVEETLWFIRGSTDVKELQDKNVNIWNSWAVKDENIEAFLCEKYEGYATDTEQERKDAFKKIFSDSKLGSIGPMYGAMWRNAPNDKVHSLWPLINVSDIPKDKLMLYAESYRNEVDNGNLSDDETKENYTSLDFYCQIKYRETIDQLNDLIIGLRDKPYSRRHLISAWLPQYLPFENTSPENNVLMERGALAPCHFAFQCFVHPPKDENSKKRLSLMVSIRSNDFCIGNPYNTAQYGLLLAMLAHVTNMDVHELVVTGGDTHVYLNHIELAKEQLKREPLPLPKLWLNPEIKSIFDFTVDDIKIIDYVSHDKIDYPIAI